jgi:hypothetical protein
MTSFNGTLWSTTSIAKAFPGLGTGTERMIRFAAVQQGPAIAFTPLTREAQGS